MPDTLYIDLGNSRLKWLYDSNTQGESVEAVFYSPDQLYRQLDSVWNAEAQPQNIWIASVANKDTLQQLTQWINDNWELVPCFMSTSNANCGVTCGYNTPSQLGVDRWAALIATHDLFPSGAVIVDCGTAITLDVIDGQGQHLGGYILPGLNSMRRSLAETTAMQWADRESDLEQHWGNDTASCIALGTRKAVVALIEQSVEKLQAAGVCDPALVLTGGDAKSLQSFIDIESRCRYALVLEGLRLYAKENKS